MVLKKINHTILKCYIKANNSRKYGLLTFASYVMGVSVLFEAANHAAGGGDLIDVVTRMFNDLAGSILRLSTAAALIGVGTGAFFKKLSFGKLEVEQTGKVTFESWVLVGTNIRKLLSGR